MAAYWPVLVAVEAVLLAVYFGGMLSYWGYTVGTTGERDTQQLAAEL